MRAHYWMVLTAIFAIGSFISFAQIDSYWADKHHFNGLAGWLGIGIVTGAAACFFLWKTAVTGGGGSSTGVGSR